jgi:dUTP pyrophosphatase
LNINIKLLNEKAKVPTKGSAAAAGYDLYAATSYDIELPPHETVKIGTGIAIEIPDGYFGGIFARSGLATKKGLRPANSVGVIDSDYRGEVIVALHNDSNLTQYIDAGERIAQLIIIPYENVTFEEVNDLSDTERGDGGFGSTGTR